MVDLIAPTRIRSIMFTLILNYGRLFKLRWWLVNTMFSHLKMIMLLLFKGVSLFTISCTEKSISLSLFMMS